MTVLRPELQASLREQADAQEGRRLRRARQRTAATATVTLAAVFVVAFGALRPDGGLASPQEAVAAVRSDLGNTGILEWIRTTDSVAGSPDPDTRAAGSTVDTTWLDLQTGDRHAMTRTNSDGVPKGSQSWVTDGVIWTDESGDPDRPAPVRTGRGSMGDGIQADPVALVRETLDRAAAGTAQLEDDVEVNRTPAVLITDHDKDQPRLTVRTWLSRGGEPRVLKYAVTDPCGESFCGGRTTPITTTYVTDVWDVHPRTPEFLSELALPERTG